MKLLLYCTKAKPYLWDNKEFCEFIQKEEGVIEPRYVLGNKVSKKEAIKRNCCEAINLNGKIVAECDFEVEEIIEYLDNCYNTETLGGFALQSRSCLNAIELDNYLKNKGGYAIHIKNLHIFDGPKELSEYYTRIKYKDRLNDYKGTDVIFPAVKTRENLYERVYDCVYCKKLEKASQNMQKIVVFNKETNEYEYAILISIQPEWLCKILNGEKTIEVRKKVLKEML